MDHKAEIAFARDVVSRELETQVHDVISIEGQGLINAVYRVEIAKGSVVLRCNSVDDPHQNFATEAWAIRQVAAVGVPVPEVLAIGEQDGLAYMIQRFIDGDSGDDRAINRLAVWRQLGVYARQFNEIRVEGYGSEMDPEQLGVFTRTWQEVLDDYRRDIFRDDFWVQDGGFTSGQIDWLSDRMAALGELTARPGLCLVDIGVNNTILKKDGTLVMIDWEMVEGAPVPQAQIAEIASYWGYPSQIVDAFIDGYGLTKDEMQEMEPVIKTLTIQSALNHVRWAQDFMPQRVDEYAESAHWIACSLFGAALENR